MIDDMQGLYSHASDAYRAGKRTGRDDFYRAAMEQLSRISLAAEKAGEVAAFRAAEDCCRALLETKRLADQPQHSV
jgi:hypothetical protein